MIRAFYPRWWTEWWIFPSQTQGLFKEELCSHNIDKNMDTKSLSLRILKMCWWMMELSIFRVKIDHCLLIKTVSSQLKTIVFEAKIIYRQEMCFKGTYTETSFNSLFALLYPQMVVKIKAKNWSGWHIEDLKQIILCLFWFRGPKGVVIWWMSVS